MAVSLVGSGVAVGIGVEVGVGAGVGIAEMVAFTLASIVAWVSMVGLVGSCSWHARTDTRITTVKVAIG